MLVDVSFALSLPIAARRLYETAFAEERSFLARPSSPRFADMSPRGRLVVIAQVDGSVPVRGPFEEAACPVSRNLYSALCAVTCPGKPSGCSLSRTAENVDSGNLTALSRHRTSALAILCFSGRTVAT